MTNKELIKELKTRVKKQVGKPCRGYYYGCFTCQAWVAVDCLEDVLGDYLISKEANHLLSYAKPEKLGGEVDE